MCEGVYWGGVEATSLALAGGCHEGPRRTLALGLRWQLAVGHDQGLGLLDLALELLELGHPVHALPDRQGGESGGVQVTLGEQMLQAVDLALQRAQHRRILLELEGQADQLTGELGDAVHLLLPVGQNDGVVDLLQHPGQSQGRGELDVDEACQMKTLLMGLPVLQIFFRFVNQLLTNTLIYHMF